MTAAALALFKAEAAFNDWYKRTYPVRDANEEEARGKSKEAHIHRTVRKMVFIAGYKAGLENK